MKVLKIKMKNFNYRGVGAKLIWIAGGMAGEKCFGERTPVMVVHGGCHYGCRNTQRLA